MKIKTNDLVIFKKGLYADEDGAVYRVLEINGDRCMLEFVSANMIICPQFVAVLSELENLPEKEEPE